MNKARSRWKWLGLVRRLGTFTASICAAILLLGWLVHRGWVVHSWIVYPILVVIGLTGGFGLLILLIVSAGSLPKRQLLADKLERVSAPLLDRLNTLVYLRARKPDTFTESYLKRIAHQARVVLLTNPSRRPPFSGVVPLLHLAVGVLMVIATFWFYSKYHPLNKIREYTEETGSVEKAEPEKQNPLEMGLPSGDQAELDRKWGEVRILEPGRDLKVTKVDAVQLKIEATATRQLSEASWFSAPNNGERVKHALDAPKEPNFASYEPVLYVDEYHLSDWDVLTYYAKASTAPGDEYSSEIYFLEVRPFREDILKLLEGAGGKDGKAAQMLDVLSDLIDQQKVVLRETHLFSNRAYDSSAQQNQDREKLSAGEQQLMQETARVYGQFASEMENTNIGDVLFHLAEAGKRMGDAVDDLKDDKMDPAAVAEQQALAELVQTRKDLQKAILNNPSAFGDGKNDQNGEQTPVSDMDNKRKEISEYRDQEKVALEKVDETLRKQREIADKAKSQPSQSYDKLAGDEEQLKKSLEQFQKENPEVFKGSQKEAADASSGFDQSIDGLKQAAGKRGKVVEEAVKKQWDTVGNLEDLKKSLKADAEQHRIADAHKLRKMLEQISQRMEDVEASPAKSSSQDLQALARQARETVNDLHNMTKDSEQEGSSGSPLKQALSDANRKELDNKLNELTSAQGDAAKTEKAGQANQMLDKIKKAFDETLPGIMQAKQGNGSSSARANQENLERGLQNLESLAVRPDKAGDAGDRAKLQKEALENLREFFRNTQKDRPSDVLLLQEIEQKLGDPLKSVDGKDLHHLIQEIQARQAEFEVREDGPAADPSLTHIDPDKLPTEYRERIEEYFKKLSEK